MVFRKHQNYSRMSTTISITTFLLSNLLQTCTTPSSRLVTTKYRNNKDSDNLILERKPTGQQKGERANIEYPVTQSKGLATQRPEGGVHGREQFGVYNQLQSPYRVHATRSARSIGIASHSSAKKDKKTNRHRHRHYRQVSTAYPKPN